MSDTRKSLGTLLTSLQMSLLMSDSVLRARSLSTPHVVHISVPGQSKLFDTTSSIYPQLVRLLVKSRAPPVTPFSTRLAPRQTPILMLGLSKICLLVGTTAKARLCVYRLGPANVYKRITANLDGKILCSKFILPTRFTLMKIHHHVTHSPRLWKPWIGKSFSFLQLEQLSKPTPTLSKFMLPMGTRAKKR